MEEKKKDLFDGEKVKQAVKDVIDVIDKKFKKNDVGFAHTYCVMVDAIKSIVTTQALIECLRNEDMTEDDFLNSVTKMSWLVGTRIMNIDEHERKLMIEARKEWLREYNDFKNNNENKDV